MSRVAPERSEYFFWDRIRIRIYSESSFWPEYEYEYIRDLTIDRIRIRIYSLFYCGPNTNIRIFKYEYEYSNIWIFQYIIWPKSTKNWSNLTQVSVFSCVWVSESWPLYTNCRVALTDLCSSEKWLYNWLQLVHIKKCRYLRPGGKN